jgi:phosphoribosylformylglycinamidine cyclo-ligase
MGLTYKKAGVDISDIKKSQAAIGRLISSTHKLQKKAKIAHGFGHYAGIVEIPGGKLLATHTDGRNQSSNCKHDEKIQHNRN